MFLDCLAVYRRSALGLALIGGLLLLFGLFGVRQLALLKAETTRLEKERLPGMALIEEIGEYGLLIRVHSLQRMLLRDPDALERSGEAVARLRTALGRREARYEQTLDTPEKQALYKQYLAAMAAQDEALGQFYRLAPLQRSDEATALIGSRLDEIGERLKETLGHLEAYERQGAQRSVAHVTHRLTSGWAWCVGVAFAGAAALILLSGSLAWRMRHLPPEQAARIAESVVVGDLLRQGEWQEGESWRQAACADVPRPRRTASAG